MPSPYLKDLIRIAREELPSLQYDLQNASTLFSLQAACQKLFNHLGIVLHHVILETVDAAPPAPPPPPRPTPVATPRTIHPPVAPPPPLGLPLPPSFAQPTPSHPAVTGMPAAQAQPGVANVFLTTQGTEVVAPTGAKTVLPAGAPVDLAASAGLAPEPPPAPPGVEQVILPPGGGMTPELQAALANRSTPTT